MSVDRHIEEPIQGLVPSWAKSKEEQDAFRERFRLMSELEDMGVSHKSKLLLLALLAITTKTEIGKAAGRIQKARQADSDAPQVRSRMVDKVRYLAHIQLIDKDLMPYALESVAHLPGKHKDRLSRLVLHPESFL